MKVSEETRTPDRLDHNHVVASAGNNAMRRSLVPLLFPVGALQPPAIAHKTSDSRFFSIGETGFEPATARPPARRMAYGSDEGVKFHWVFFV